MVARRFKNVIQRRLIYEWRINEQGKYKTLHLKWPLMDTLKKWWQSKLMMCNRAEEEHFST